MLFGLSIVLLVEVRMGIRQHEIAGGFAGCTRSTDFAGCSCLSCDQVDLDLQSYATPFFFCNDADSFLIIIRKDVI